MRILVSIFSAFLFISGLNAQFKVSSLDKDQTVINLIDEENKNNLDLLFGIIQDKSNDRFPQALYKVESLLKKFPKDTNLLFLASEISHYNQESNKARGYLEEAMRLAPNNQDYILKYIHVFLNPNLESDKIIEQYQKLIKLNPGDKFTKYEYSYFLMKNGKIAQTIALTEDILEQSPNDEAIILQLANLHLLNNDKKKAKTFMERFQNISPNDPYYIEKNAEFLESISEESKAEELYEKILKIDSFHPKGLMYLSRKYLKNKDTQNALKVNLKMVENPNISMDSKIGYISYALYSKEKLSSQLYQQYLAMAQKLYALHPNEAKTAAMMGDFYFMDNQYPLAKSFYVKSYNLSEHPTHDVLMNLLQSCLNANDYDTMKIYATKGLETNSLDRDLYLYHGIASQYTGALQESIKSYQKVIKYSPERSHQNAKFLGQIHANLAEVYHQLKDYTNSDENFEKAIKFDPSNAYTLNNYAYYLALRKQNLSRAKEMSKQSLESIPNSASFNDTYAYILFLQNDFEQAKLFQEKAIEASNNNPSATLLEHYGDILYHLSEKDKALEYWQKSQTLGNNEGKLLQKIKLKKYID
ncbi:MAG: tetratricopeptide repeat protein [Chitinophagales bacterium]|nr:tetratricopeptide repeat protein [Chitinophagales bacterium]